ncbi:GDSL-type esterase/lipase family protein [Saccharothrix australiensis]|uniref:GDSL-like lipase/acylhydrolase family protein n=1 Tax=Saccharothrix australiensis TaxID=2072 RepID=A0A495W3C4_9PSEU|nr:GDSL-type esterase/lipase family protein [Saccharothrix australiensis]RKT54318.1 GDSL-like lipase/acylhydrolase family protein [Saccharothrix australiensis]
MTWSRVVGAVVLAAASVVALPVSAGAVDTRPTAVVSLGDSAMSGEGAGAYEPGTEGENGNWCHRSTRAMVHRTRLADHTVNLACSGADSAHVSLAGTTHYTEGSQARRLVDVGRRYRVTTVLVQVGANDDPRFADTMVDCVAAWANPFGPGCRSALAEEWPARLAAMAPKVERAVRDVRSAMTRAGYADSAYALVLTSYASPVTEEMDGLLHGPQGCPIRLADAAYGRTVAVPQLSEALRGVAVRTGARFLDLSRATEGREACAEGLDPDGEWQRRLTVDPHALVHGGLDAIGLHLAQQSFHPNAAGHEQLGRCVTEFVWSGASAARCLEGSDGGLHAVAPA